MYGPFARMIDCSACGMLAKSVTKPTGTGDAVLRDADPVDERLAHDPVHAVGERPEVDGLDRRLRDGERRAGQRQDCESTAGRHTTLASTIGSFATMRSKPSGDKSSVR
jgi:hypothetical protein